MSSTIMAAPAASPSAPQAKADVTVVIPTFNRASYLCEAIDSMLAQTVAPARIMIVDDGSTDDTATAVQAYAGAVDYVRQLNAGKAAALNHALASITTRYTWFFDDDDAVYPHALETLLLSAGLCPDAAFAFGSFDLATPLNQRLLDAPVRPAPYRHGGESLVQQRLHLYRDYTIAMSGSLLRTAVVREVGGLDTNLIRCQDYDLMVRLACRFAFCFCGSSIFVVRKHDGPRGSASTLHAHADRGRVWARYNEPIGRFLRHALPLQAFSPSPERLPVGEERSDALINRAWALAPKVPTIDSVDDLLEATKANATGSLSARQIELLANTYHDDFVAYKSVLPLLRLCKMLATPIGPLVLGHLARGLYWLGKKQVQWHDRFRFAAVALALTIVARVGGAFMREVR